MIRNCQWNTGKSWAHLSSGIDFSYSKRILQILKCSLFTFPQALNKKLKIRNIGKHGNKKNMEKGVDMISTIL